MGRVRLSATMSWESASPESSAAVSGQVSRTRSKQRRSDSILAVTICRSTRFSVFRGFDPGRGENRQHRQDGVRPTGRIPHRYQAAGYRFGGFPPEAALRHSGGPPDPLAARWPARSLRSVEYAPRQAGDGRQVPRCPHQNRHRPAPSQRNQRQGPKAGRPATPRPAGWQQFQGRSWRPTTTRRWPSCTRGGTRRGRSWTRRCWGLQRDPLRLDPLRLDTPRLDTPRLDPIDPSPLAT